MQTLASFFNDVMAPASMPPDSWRATRMIVLFKKGNAADPSNYRPISLLPIMYKLFTKLIGSRINVVLDAAQSVDQAGFRSGFSCEDHLFTVCRVLETTREFQIPVWAATIDYRKAFDTVEHGSIWEALNDFGVPKANIRILANIYREQVGSVATEVQSKPSRSNVGRSRVILSALLYSMLFWNERFETFRKNGGTRG